MRRPTPVELMLLATVLLWALNLSVTKYILDEGLEPLSYATIRYGLAGAIFVALTLLVERTLRIERRHLLVIAFATVTLWLNQVCFVLALDKTTASTIGLLLGAIPIFAALFGLALGRERLTGASGSARRVSFLGRRARRARIRQRGLRSATSGSSSASAPRDVGRVLGRGRAAMRDVLAVARERRRDPAALGPHRARRAPADARPGLVPRLADLAAPGFATLGPLVLTNVFWFRSIHGSGRRGRPSRRTCSPSSPPCSR